MRHKRGQCLLSKCANDRGEEVIVADDGCSRWFWTCTSYHDRQVVSRVAVDVLTENAESVESASMKGIGTRSEAPPHVAVVHCSITDLLRHTRVREPSCRNDLLPAGLPAVQNEQCEAAVIAKSGTETAARNVCPTRRLEPADEAIL